MMYLLGKLLGIEGLESVVKWHVQFAAPWAHGRPALVLFCCVAMAVLSVVFYVRYQGLRNKSASVFMAVFRAVLLIILVCILAEPEIEMEVRQNPRPLLLMLFDGTDSMNMTDGISDETQAAFEKALGDDALKFDDDTNRPTRQNLVQASLRSEQLGWLDKLSKKFRLRSYVLDQPDQVREILMRNKEDSELVDTDHVADKLEGTKANVTALGTAMDDLRRRSRSHLLAGVVVVSDFDQNRGQPVLHAAERLKVPIYTVGVGPSKATNLSVGLQAPMVLKKGEKTTITVLLRQSGLDGQDVEVELLTRRLGTIEGAIEGEQFERAASVETVRLDSESVTAEITYEPQVTGRFTLQARVRPLDAEVLTEDNSDERDVMIRDESLKLLFVEHEPTWEWRFVKEVFHRHPMIGREGFRTYLDSADFSVRRGNDLFIETLVRSREEFFSYDIIFLSDVPSRTLSPHFQDMLQEYVRRFGGGLVVLAGSRHGPSSLLNTKIADMLPIVPGPGIRIRHGQFNLRLTPKAKQYDFMRLGENDYENALAWSSLRGLQWYQPGLRPHPLATVLAEHPRDRCVDAKTPQPLIAVRRYGKGEVVYFAFNETWRLRRLYGEKYYSQLWGQLIYRMGLSRALGSQKRFRVETDREVYQAGQKVRVTVEAYNRNYEPLALESGSLSARLLAQQTSGESEAAQTLVSIPLSRDKVIYETSVPVFTSGLHRLMVKDPVTLDEVETTFKVSPTTAEGRSAVRDLAMQRALADNTGGKSYELYEVASLADDIGDRDLEDTSNRRLPLWNTWLILVVGLTLMLGEWLTRKLMNLQ
ncbi:MAG: hypothetical protein QGH60_11975 [Phycisphaerae bacterium]|jgi:hypothetical protein|nr:hypothetical protein [Phycisphaerae bacterium]